MSRNPLDGVGEGYLAREHGGEALGVREVEGAVEARAPQVAIDQDDACPSRGQDDTKVGHRGGLPVTGQSAGELDRTEGPFDPEQTYRSPQGSVGLCGRRSIGAGRDVRTGDRLLPQVDEGDGGENGEWLHDTRQVLPGLDRVVPILPEQDHTETQHQANNGGKGTVAHRPWGDRFSGHESLTHELRPTRRQRRFDLEFVEPLAEAGLLLNECLTLLGSDCGIQRGDLRLQLAHLGSQLLAGTEQVSGCLLTPQVEVGPDVGIGDCRGACRLLGAPVHLDQEGVTHAAGFNLRHLAQLFAHLRLNALALEHLDLGIDDKGRVDSGGSRERLEHGRPTRGIEGDAGLGLVNRRLQERQDER